MQASLETFSASLGQSKSSNPMKDDMDKLGQLLEAGDLTGAQSLFKTMQEHMQAHGQSSSQTSQQDDLSLFSAVGTALDAGDTCAAQKAWSKLEEKLQSMGAPPPPPPKDNEASSGSSSKSSSISVSELEALLASLSWQSSITDTTLKA